jgi:photosystem II stability/assembly factor-like uncharacterized protein
VRVLRHVVAMLIVALAIPAASGAQTPDTGLFDGVLSYRSVGPDKGGRSIAVGGSVARPNEYWFGATGGGLWKTTDGGTTWNPTTDQKIASSSVGAVEVCPTDPDVVYIGMGEVQLRGDIITGDGVYKTTDGGQTWTHLDALIDDGQSAIGRLRVDPTDCDRVFAAVLGHPFGPNENRGLFRSTDGGTMWKKVLYQNALAGAVDLSIDPNDPDTIYAGFWHAYRKPWLLNSGGEGSGVFKSTDGGDTWEDLTDNPGMPKAPIGNVGVSVSGADSNRVYAIVEAADGGVFASDDAGATWRRVSEDRNLRQRAFYYTRIYADPQQRDTVYVLNVDFWKSTDGGQTYDDIDVPHGDNHDLWIAPGDNRRMIEGNDGGANVTVNGGDNWTDQDYPTAQMYHVTTTDDTPYLICGAQQDNDTACVPSDGSGDEYFDVGGGESGYIAVDPRDSNVFYAGSYGGFLTRFDRSTEQARNVNPWPDNPMGHPAKDLQERFQWTFPIMTSGARPNTVYAGSQHLFASTNEGQSWQRISPDLTRADPETLGDSGGPITKDQTSIEYYATIFAIAPSPIDRNVIWTGSDDGLVHVTRDHGRSWERVTPPLLPRHTRISIIDASPHDPGTAYVAAHRYRQDDVRPYLFRTTDYGETWTRITHGIPRGDFAWAIREDPERKDLLFAGTEHGVYVSFDAGDAWQPLRLDMPDVSVQDLTIKDNDLVVATHGRGFYVLDDLAPLRQLTPQSLRSDMHLFRPGTPTLPADKGLTVDYLLGARAESATLELTARGGRSLGTKRVAAGRGAHRVTLEPPAGFSGPARVRLRVDGRRAKTRTATVLRKPLTVDVAEEAERSERREQRLELADIQQRSGDEAEEEGREEADEPPPPKQAPAGDGPVDLLDPTDPVRSVDDEATFYYRVREGGAPISITVLDARGTEVRKLEDLPTEPGLQQVSWNLRYPGPTTFPGIVFWAASPTRGAKAPWGGYRVQLTAGQDTDVQEFAIGKDPRLTDIRQRDIDEQFALATRIVDRTSDANGAVIRIRGCKQQIAARSQAGDDDVKDAGAALSEALGGVEEAIYQVRLQSSQDPLNFPIRLNNKIAALLGVLESADDRPTDQTYDVFDLLSGQLQEQLDEVDRLAARDVAAYNALLRDRGLEPIEC